MLNDFAYTPDVGLLDTVAFPTDPADESAARQQFMTLLNQIKTYLNGSIKPEIAALSPDPNKIFCDMRRVRYYG